MCLDNSLFRACTKNPTQTSFYPFTSSKETRSNFLLSETLKKFPWQLTLKTPTQSFSNAKYAYIVRTMTKLKNVRPQDFRRLSKNK